jgi:hypothetical protein
MSSGNDAIDLGTTENHPSWLLQEERLQNVDSMFDTEPMNSLSFQFIYINTHDYIDKITCQEETLTITNGGSYLPKESLIHIIEQHKIKTTTAKYKLEDVYLCNFDILPSNIHDFTFSYTDETNATRYMKEISPVDDVIIQPSTFLFHDMNTMYVIYREQETIRPRTQTKSILKSSSDGDNPNGKKVRNTKKVRISMNYNLHDKNSNISNKRRTKKKKGI